jgi:hypothetical protein
VSQSAMPVMCRVLVPEVLPVMMPEVPAVPEVLPAPLPELALAAHLPAEGRAALAAALAGPVPGGQRPGRGELIRAAGLPAGTTPGPRGCAGSSAPLMTPAGGKAACTRWNTCWRCR